MYLIFYKLLWFSSYSVEHIVKNTTSMNKPPSIYFLFEYTSDCADANKTQRIPNLESILVKLSADNGLVVMSVQNFILKYLKK